MSILKKIHHSDLLLLRDLFCGREKNFIIYDPLHCVAGEITGTYADEAKQLFPDQGDRIIFNLSYDLFPENIKSDFIFHFNLKKAENYNSFFYINNPDGTMRWIYPASVKEPHFLELYNSAGLKSAIYKYLVKLAYTGGMKNRIASGSFFLQQKGENKVEQLVGNSSDETYSIFTGTTGENRKSIISLHHRSHTTHFIKIAFNEKPQLLIKNELYMLTTLSKYDFTALSLPHPGHTIDPSYAKLTSVKPGVVIPASRLRDIHIKALGELYLTNHERRKIRNTPAWENISNQMRLLDKEHEIVNDLDATIVYGIIQKLFDLHNSIDIDCEVPVSFAHGDFTPWNMYTDDHRLYVYDWELGGAGMPMLLDLFHFIFQSQVLLFRKDFISISQVIRETLQNKHTVEIINRYKINTGMHYQLYLLFNISYYIRLYMNQKPLHAQAHWLVSTWNQALNELK